MVRVINVHHFAGQQILTVEQPTASTTAPPHRLLLALSSHCVEVRDLKADGDVLFTFPTVDEVTQILHCLNGVFVGYDLDDQCLARAIQYGLCLRRVKMGFRRAPLMMGWEATSQGLGLLDFLVVGDDKRQQVLVVRLFIPGDYVATMETKYNRQNRELNFVRVYVNWDSVACMQQSKMNSSGASLGHSECGMLQPMRARIAGRVTPTTNQSELGSLEMIEIPTKRNPSAIQLCQISGNILILSGKIVNLYSFEVKTHDISKLKFIDFEELPLNIDLSFAPSQMEMCENYLAFMNTDSMLLFKLVTDVPKESTPDTSECHLSFKYNEDDKVDYKKLLRDEEMNLTTDRLTVNLPMILRENSVIHKHSPFTFCDRDLAAAVKVTSTLEAKWQNVTTENLIQLKLRPILIENAQKQISEEFKYLILKPLYIDETFSRVNKLNEANKILKSCFRTKLHSMTCLIATQQEGYMYQFCDQDNSGNIDNCITVYPFTSPVHRIVLEDYFLHALTESGLESYTVRTGHHMCRRLQAAAAEEIASACPSVADSVCLAGLRPFLGIEQMLLSDNHIVLLANGDTSPTHSVGSNSSSTTSYWTLYSLELPTPKTVFNDISIVANAHRFTSAQTYCHLISEAHMVLRMSLILCKWSTIESNVALLKPKRNNNEDIYEAYRTSCALLADHYIMCNTEADYCLAVPYYKMASVTPYEVIKRVTKIQEQANTQNVKGLIYYLKTILFDSKASAEIFNSCSKQNFAEAVLDLFERHNFQELPNLILKVTTLREYGTDKLINILNSGDMRNEISNNQKLLALVTLYILRGNFKRSHELLNELSKESLWTLLLDNWELLFETYGGKRGTYSFSELTIILMNMYPDLLSDLFLSFVEDKRAINLSKLLKVFLEYLPSSIGHDANQGSMVLQKTLELYFKKFYNKHENRELSSIVYDRPTHDAIKLLVRSYLSQLQLSGIKEVKEKSVLDENEKEETENETDKDLQQEKFKYNMINKTCFNDGKKDKPTEFFLFSELRHEYLNRMPPFQPLTNPNLEKKKQPKQTKQDEIDFTLKKLQAMMCSQAVPNQVILEVNAFLALNENLRGHLSLQACIMTVNDAVLFLIESCPQCLLQYGKDRFTKSDEWKFLIATVQRRILRMSQDEEQSRACLYYKKLLKDILSHVATNMNLEHLLNVFPQHMNYSTGGADDPADCSDGNTDILNEIQDYDPYITLCKETMHANQIKKLITATGQQLLYTLNL